MRSTRRPIECPEETGVEESVCSVEAPNSLITVQTSAGQSATVHPVESAELSEITTLSVKNLTKFWKVSNQRPNWTL